VKNTILTAVIVSIFAAVASAGSLDVRLQRRDKSGPKVSPAKWDVAKTAILVCDMWDKHWCKGATRRVAEMASPMNRTIAAARKRGMLIIHSPSSCIGSYTDHPARKRAQSAPKASDTPPWIANWAAKLASEKDAVWPIDQSDGGCDCEPKCKSRRAWKRQIAAVEIADSDAITDSGVETWSLLKQRGIDNVIVMGVHTNMCVIGRPFGLRNLKRAGKNVVLMRDLTDTMYNSRKKPYVSHFKGTGLIVDYIETYVCPTITSLAITGKPPFAFKITPGPAARPVKPLTAVKVTANVIGVDIAGAGGPVESGWVGWTQTRAVRLGAGFDKDFIAELNGGLDWRDRGDKSGSPRLEGVLRDGYKTSGNNIRLTFKGLTAGDYRLVLYSCDLLWNQAGDKGKFDVLVNGKKILDKQGSPGRNRTEKTAMPPIPLKSDGKDIVIEFKHISGEIWLNGFVLAKGGSGAMPMPKGGARAQAVSPSDNAPKMNVAALRRAITDLTETFGSRYPKGAEYLKRLDAAKEQTAFDVLQREALLANPLLDFDKLLVVKRRPNKNGKPGNPDLARGWDIGFPRSSYGKSSLKINALDGEIAVLSPVAPDGKLSTLYRPKKPLFVGDVDLHFDGSRMLFTKRDARGNFQIHEISAKGGDPRQVTRGEQVDVHNHDACYLPNNDIVFASTACFQGVPCNKSKVALLYRMNSAGQKVRQLCFDQDHNFHPAIQEDGRVMYLRWEYSDLPHTFSRIMFQMNPDGTGQMALYGASSYWPNGIYSARPIPGKPTMFAGVVAGHHDCYRTGELIVFDVARGRHEADGVVQRIPGFGKKVQPLIQDKLTSRTWPKFAHPYPLSDKYYLTTCKLDARAPWDIYLVDVFDNMLRLRHADGWGLFEPIPFRKTRRPAVIPDKVDLKRKDATVMLADIYRGPGLAGVPRGAIKRLRLVTLHYCYQGLGGQYDRVGLDGPWDVKQVLGTVPVESDGSANFRIPANTPISVQPLDAEGKAVQLMRSWLVGMPGEVVSCVGCHEKGNMSSSVKQTIALRREPSKIKPFYGPRRGFSFDREIQPVLDKYCLACHNGKERTDGKKIPDLSLAKEAKYRAGHFTPSYMALRRLLRTPTMEPDMHMLATGDFHADTTELVQMLTKGHHNVKLSDEAWQRLITWIDIQAPAHGTWRAIAGDKRVLHQADRRRELLKLYTGRDENPEPLATTLRQNIKPIVPEPEDQTPPKKVTCEGWPFDATQAAAKQRTLGQTRRTIDLGKDLKLELMHIPSGKFVMNAAPVAISKPFWIGRLEITNKQYAAFNPSHDSRMEPGDALHFEAPARGFALNSPEQPVARVSWNRAVEFCKWLAKKSGKKVSLPSEAQWEWACRAGTNTPMWYGQPDTNFASQANLADATFKNIINYGGYDKAANVVPPWRPAADGIDDKYRVSSPVGKFKPNAWGLGDMHGNVAEWTRSFYKPDAPQRRVARGGSWYDRPKRATSAFRAAYKPWLGIYNVGFRVVVEN
jgi:formylglycine-generating enzyme required for sulfatase activity/nicotinamidase-related amidase